MYLSVLHFDARQLNARSKWESSFSSCMAFCMPVWRRLQCNVSVIPSRVPHHVPPPLSHPTCLTGWGNATLSPARQILVHDRSALLLQHTVTSASSCCRIWAPSNRLQPNGWRRARQFPASSGCVPCEISLRGGREHDSRQTETVVLRSGTSPGWRELGSQESISKRFSVCLSMYKASRIDRGENTPTGCPPIPRRQE